MFIPFPSLKAFDRLMALQNYMRENAPKHYDPIVSVRPKIKLHGANAAFGTGPGGPWAQSRSTLLSREQTGYGAHDPLMGFARRIRESQDDLMVLGETVVVFGEWAGAGVKKNDAITQIGRKMFFPFVVCVFNEAEVGATEDVRQQRRAMRAYTDPDTIRRMIGFEDPALMVLPWAGPLMQIDTADPEATESALTQINARSEAVGVQDDFVRQAFGIEGPGEGLVYAPDTEHGPVNLQVYADFSFKAKAERHRVKATQKAATAKTEIPETAHAFVEAFGTENRMEQMLTDKLGGDTSKRRTGEFVKAVLEDVMKESETEREALGVEDKILSGLITKRASQWFLNRATTAYDPQG